MTAWIQSHQALSRHRKTLRAVAVLKVDRHKLIGHLHELWWWGLDNASTDGFLGDLTPEEIAEAAGWPVKDARRFVEALVAAGFIESREDGYWLHDWYDYAGKINDKRTDNRKRMRTKRARAEVVQCTCSAQTTNVQCTCDAQPVHVQDVCDARAPAREEERREELTPSSPPTRGRPRRTARSEFTDQDRSDLIAKWGDGFGGTQAVEHVIEDALNSTARLTKFSERRYVDGWLRRELGYRDARAVAVPRNGHDTVTAPPLPTYRTGQANV